MDDEGFGCSGHVPRSLVVGDNHDRAGRHANDAAADLPGENVIAACDECGEESQMEAATRGSIDTSTARALL